MLFHPIIQTNKRSSTNQEVDSIINITFSLFQIVQTFLIKIPSRTMEGTLGYDSLCKQCYLIKSSY